MMPWKQKSPFILHFEIAITSFSMMKFCNNVRKYAFHSYDIYPVYTSRERWQRTKWTVEFFSLSVFLEVARKYYSLRRGTILAYSRNMSACLKGREYLALLLMQSFQDFMIKLSKINHHLLVCFLKNKIVEMCSVMKIMRKILFYDSLNHFNYWKNQNFITIDILILC